MPQLNLEASGQWIKLCEQCTIDASQILDAPPDEDARTVALLYKGDFLETLPAALPEPFHRWRDGLAATIRNKAISHLIRGVDQTYRNSEWHSCLAIGAALEKMCQLESAVSEKLKLCHDLLAVDQTSVGVRATPKFVGRREEIRSIRQVWARGADDQAKIVVIRGESGIGKTRLAERFARIAALEGAFVATARCYLAEKHVPFAPAFAMTEGLTSHQHEDLPGIYQDITSAKERTRVREEPEVTPDSKHAIFNAISKAIRHAAANRRIIVWLDDIQWCDESTSEWLHYFIRACTNSSPLLLLCQRDEELGTTSATWLHTAENVHMVRLDAMSTEESAELVQATIGATGISIPSSRAREIMRQAAGHPFYLVTLAMHSLEDDERHRSYGLCEQTVPEPIHRIVAYRLNKLSPAARAVAETLAAAGSGIDVDCLSAATGMTNLELLGTLAELEEAKLVRANPLDLAHDLVKQALYEMIPPSIRQLRHRQLFLSMADAVASTKALHAARARMPAEAYRQSCLAADHAKRVYAYKEAIFFQRLALDNTSTISERRLTLIGLIELLTLLDQYSEASRYLPECREVCKMANDEDGLLLCDITHVASELAMGTAAVSELWKSLSRTIAVAAGSKNEKRLSAAVKLTLSFQQNITDQVELIRVHSLAEELSVACAPPVRAEILCAISGVMAFFDGTRALALSNEAVAIGMSIGEPTIRIRTLSTRGLVKLITSDFSGALEDLAETEQYADDSMSDTMFQTYANRACILYDKGHFKEARAANMKAMAFRSRHHLVVLMNEATGYRNSYDLPNTLIWANRALAENRTLAAPWVDVAAKSLIGLAYFDAGLQEQGVAEADDVSELLLANAIQLVDWSYTTMLLSRADAAKGDVSRARQRVIDTLRDKYCNHFARSRLELELATLLLHDDEDLAYAYATKAAERASAIGGLTLLAQSSKILEEIRLHSGRPSSVARDGMAF